MGPFLLCFVLSGAAAAAGHRERAQVAESTGHVAQAAKEYEEAYTEEGAPDLLYRLGLVRRKLKHYELAQEAFRGYLRAAPEGPFREEVMRQLSELGVLLEEQHRQVPDEQHKKPRQQRRNTPVKGLTPPPAQPSPGASQSATASGGAPQDTTSDFTASAASTTGSSPITARDPDAAASTSAPPGPFPVPPASADAGSAAAAPAAPISLPAARTEAPLSATRAEPSTTHTVSARSRAAPWVAAGAAALAIGGAALWWDGDRTSSDLDARFASGDLTAADNGRYGRARRESIAGRAMVAGAAVLGAFAVALWW